MQQQKLPSRLKKEPLVEAVFESRFASGVDASDILPGFLHAALKGGVQIERLPIGELPKLIRDQDQQLASQPLVRVHAGQFTYLIGSKSLGISCNLPYPGWSGFNVAIQEMLGYLDASQIATAVTRYSMKYIDIIDSNSLADSVHQANVSIKVGPHQLTDEAFKLQMSVRQDGILHLIEVGAPGLAQMSPGIQRNGLLVAIDSIVETNVMPLPQFMNGSSGRLKKLHSSNKAMFFDCLKPSTIARLEPVYE
jgi:uncharacterized protein (TIGR04255 family)